MDGDRQSRRRQRARRRWVVAGGAGLLTLSAAGGAAYLVRSDDSPQAAPTTTTTMATTTTTLPPPTTPPPTAPPRDPVLGNGQPVTFAFGGDAHFEAHLADLLEGEPDTMLAEIAPVLSAADVAMVNLETSLTERGEPLDKEYTFRAPGTALVALSIAGVDAVAAANNHSIDFGPRGLEDTLAAEQFSGFPLVGIGANAPEAYAPHRIDIRGQRIAIFAATDVLDGIVVDEWPATDTRAGIAATKDVDPLLAAVTAARADSDTIVVFMHWGVERDECPSERQQELARLLVDAGADIIVGGHAHRQQGAGRLDAAFVAYGLGNFIWYNENGPQGATGVLRVTATGRRIDTYEWVPAVIDNGVPRPRSPESAATALEEWNALRECTGLVA